MKLTELKTDEIKGSAATAAFEENLIDVHNPAHNERCTSDLKTKIIKRFVRKDVQLTEIPISLNPKSSWGKNKGCRVQVPRPLEMAKT